MDTSGSIALWQRIERIEQSLCLRVNRGCRYPWVKGLLSVVSRLGDGGIWYLLVLVLVVNGEGTAWVAGQMAGTGLVGMAIYKRLKERLVREHPYIANAGIEVVVDRISHERRHLSRFAKDLGSSAVLLSLLLAGMTWVLVLSGRLN